MRRLRIRVAPPDYRARNARLFKALEALFPVEFVGEDSPDRPADAVLLVGLTRAQTVAEAQHGLPCLAVMAESGGDEVPRVRVVQFGRSNAVPPEFRHRVLSERRSAMRTVPVVPGPNDVVMATCDGHPVWIRRPGAAGKGALDISSVPLPTLGAEDALIQFLNREGFLRVLPLLSFLKTNCGESDWSTPASRACLVLDDVNLRRETYGCVSFRALAQSTQERNYHAAVAVIPLDAGWVDAATASLFRDRPDRLSILIHGNNHLKSELARERSAIEQMVILAEARRRMIRLMEEHGLTVCAVAEPPYGIFQTSYVQAFLALEYEATLCTARQFLRCNPASAISPSFGLAGAECFPGGLAMIPRIPAAPGWETESVLAAFLGQPVVIAGHHFDADHNLRFVEQVADYVSGLAPITWSNLSDVAASRFVWRQDQTTLRIRAFSRRIVAAIPNGVEALVVERPWIASGVEELLRLGSPGRVSTGRQCANVSSPFPVVGGQSLEIVSPVANPIDPMKVASPRASPWPIVRRMLAETRDRCYPYLPSYLRHRPGFAQSDE